jgi:hypothetical protein
MVRLFSIRTGGGAGGGTIGGASSRFLVSIGLREAAGLVGGSMAGGAAGLRVGAALKGRLRASCCAASSSSSWTMRNWFSPTS